jgi:cold shock CspA family protein
MGRYKDYDREPKRGGYDEEQGTHPPSANRSDQRSSPPQAATGGKPKERRPATPSQVTGQVEESIGTVTMYKADKGFGFAKQDGGGKDVFIHATALQRSGLGELVEGQRVRMQFGQGKKGLEAHSIELL